AKVDANRPKAGEIGELTCPTRVRPTQFLIHLAAKGLRVIDREREVHLVDVAWPRDVAGARVPVQEECRDRDRRVPAVEKEVDRFNVLERAISKNAVRQRTQLERLRRRARPQNNSGHKALKSNPSQTSTSKGVNRPTT